jgi:hypothetical protein
MLHSLNELYNARRARLEASAGHIPNLVWRVIFLLGLLTVGLTALMGVHNLAMHFTMVAGLTTALVVVVALIVQLDYPFRGAISVSAEPFERRTLRDRSGRKRVSAFERGSIGKSSGKMNGFATRAALTAPGSDARS